MRNCPLRILTSHGVIPVLVAALVLWQVGCSPQSGSPSAVPAFDTPLTVHAHAPELIAVRLSGTITSVTDPNGLLEDGVRIGDAVSGMFVYDETAPDEHPQPDVGRYRFRDPRFMMAVDAGRLSFASDPATVDITIRLVNDKKTQSVTDRFEVKSTGNGDVLPGVGVTGIDILLVDETATALSSDALARQCPNAVCWLPTRTLTVTGLDGWTVEARIDLVPASDAPRRRGAKEKFRGV
jgi:hypothetical protein